MPSTIRAVLFDLDGVLVTTDEFHYLAWKSLAEARGWRFDREVNHRLRGVPRRESLEIVLAHNGVELSEDEKWALTEEKNATYVALLDGLGAEHVIPHAGWLLGELRQRGVATAVCSSSKNAPHVLKALGLESLFDAVVTGADVEKNKPHPDIFLLAAKRLGLHPFNCLVFEDAVAGIEAARRAKMRHVGVGTPGTLPNASQWTDDYRQLDLDALLGIAKVARIPADPWKITQAPGKPAGYWESVFALCNGHIGLRGTPDEEAGPQVAAPGFFLNGLYGLEKDMGFRTAGGRPCRSTIMMNLADWRIAEVSFPGDTEPALVQEHRELDLATGILTRTREFATPSGERVRVISERLVSMVRRPVAAIRVRVESETYAGPVRIVSRIRHKTTTRQFGLDGARLGDVSGSPEAREFGYEMFGSGLACRLAVTHRVSGMGAASCNECEGDFDELVWSGDIRNGQTIAMEKFCATLAVDSPGESLRIASEAREDGFDAMATEQREWWAKYWRIADIAIDGPVADQQAIRFNLFQLRQNHPEDSVRSISATGLTGANYMGWVFWDTEMFMFPVFLHTEPEAARRLLEFRCSQLDAARAKASEFGLPGALFPWSTINGNETNSGHMVSTAQYHINADIAHAFRLYVERTGDWAFLYERGAEVIFETLRFLAAHGRFLESRNGEFCLHTVCGPDEYNYPVNNNAYTNAMMREHGRFALTLHAQMYSAAPEILRTLSERIGLGAEEIATWEAIVERTRIPFDAARNLHEQHDGYFHKYPADMRTIPQYYEVKLDLPELRMLQLQITKQADVVLLMHVLGEQFSKEIKKANYDYYEPRTLHASSLSPSVHGLVASEIGYDEAAHDYFQMASRMDLDDVKDNASDGIHFACAGGSILLVLEGFLGVRHEPGGLVITPRLPSTWHRCETVIRHRLGQVWIGVGPNSLEARLLEGAGIQIRTGAKMISLSAEAPTGRLP